MAISIDHRSSTSDSGSSTVTLSNFVITASSPMIVEVQNDSGLVPLSVTWNTTENLSVIGTKASGSGGQVVSVYGLKTPTPGTHNIVVTWPSAPTGDAVFAISTIGGDRLLGWRSVFLRNDVDGVGPALTVTDAVNGDVVFHAAAVLATTITFGGSETTASTIINNIQSNTVSAGLSTKAATGSTAVSCSSQSVYAEMAFALIAGPELIWAGRVM